MAQVFELDDPSRPAYDGRPYRPVRTTVWLPDGDGSHPVVLLSHGTGGEIADVEWLALALRAAGIAVVGVDHHGNTSREPYDAEGFARNWDRPRDLSFALDQLLKSELGDRLDAGRVGAAGFSLGGYTAAALVGARLDPARLLEVFDGEVEPGPLPEFPNLLDELRRRITEPLVWLDGAGDSWQDTRVRAAFLIAPSQLPLLDPVSVRAIDRPVEVRWGGADDNMIPAENAMRYVELIPAAHGRSMGEAIGHYEFVDPDGDGATICAEVGAEAAAFFGRHLA